MSGRTGLGAGMAAAIMVMGVTPGLAAQATLYTVFGDAAGDLFGARLAAAGDVNRDGVEDFLVTADDYVRVYSGVDGQTLHDFAIASDATAPLGASSVGDVDGDGFADILVADPWDDTFAPDSGKATVHSGADGSVLLTFFGQLDSDRLGLTSTGLGDVDRDGVPDFAITTDDGGFFNLGEVTAFSGQDGTALWSVQGTLADALFGLDVDAAGDVDKDGVPDLIVAAPGLFPKSNTGNALLFSGVDGSILRELTGNAAQLYAYRVSAAGDVNRDGYDDVVVGEPGNEPAGLCPCAGTTYVYSGLDGSVLHQIEGAGPDKFGWSVDELDDLNQDGWPDVLVGSEHGGVRIVSGQDGSLLADVFGDAGDLLGWAVAGLGDVNGDGFVDYAASATSSASFTGPGYARVVSGYAPWYGQGQSLAGPAGTPSLVGDGRLHGGDRTSLALTGGPANSAGTLVIGLSTLNAPLLGGVLVPAPDVLVDGLVTDGAGGLVLSGTWPSGIPPGLKTWYQVWFVDAPEPGDVAASNGLMATTR